MSVPTADAVDARRAARRRAQAWFTDPALVPISSAYDRRETPASRRLALEVALADLGRSPGAILDLGSGDGEGLALAARRCPGARLTGVDPSPHATFDTAAIAALAGRDVVIARATAEDVGAEVRCRGPFDLVLAHLNWALWEEPAAGLRAVASLLAPGGLVYVVDVEGSASAAGALQATAQTSEEARYLADQSAASFLADEVDGLLGPVDPEFTVDVRRGGLGGHGFSSPRAGELARTEGVREALRAFPPAASPAAADAVLHVRVRRR